MISDFERLQQEVELGIAGRNNGIPIGFNRLNSHIGIRKSIYFLIGGLTGSGKTSLLDDAFVLNPLDWYLQNRHATNIRLKIVYRSMERNRVYKFAKWVGRKIFLDHGVIIPIAKMLGWNKKDKLSSNEHDLVMLYKDYIGEISEIMDMYDGPENPVGIAKELKDLAESRGKIEQIDQFNKIYIPNDPHEVVLVILDTLNLLKITKTLPTKKAAIDKMSDELRYARDFFGYTPVAVSQFNRDISNPIRIRNGDVEPQLEDFKESGQTQDD